jgi:hypothetical protein
MSHDPFEVWFDSQRDMWPSQWHAAQAAWQAAQEQPAAPTLDAKSIQSKKWLDAMLKEQPAAPALLTIGRGCVMCGHMNVWDVEQAAPRAPLSDEQIDAIANRHIPIAAYMGMEDAKFTVDDCRRVIRGFAREVLKRNGITN